MSSIDSNNGLKLARKDSLKISVADTQTYRHIHTNTTTSNSKAESDGNFH